MPGTTAAEILALGGTIRGGRAARARRWPPASDSGALAPSSWADCGSSRRRTPRRAGTRAPSLLKLTSGSTGLPKAALTTEAQLIADGTQIAAAMGIRPSDTQIAVDPAVALLRARRRADAAAAPGHGDRAARRVRAARSCRRTRGSSTRASSRRAVHVRALRDATRPPAGWPPGAAALDLGRRAAAGRRRCATSTIASASRSIRSTARPRPAASPSTTATRSRDEPTSGRPLPGVTITLQPDAAAPAERTGARAKRGGRAAATPIANEDGFDERGFLTGDYGAWDARGRLTLCGRVSAFVNVAGRKVQPDEVEQVLRAMPGVADVRVLGGARCAPRPADRRLHCRARRRPSPSSPWPCAGSAPSASRRTRFRAPS